LPLSWVEQASRTKADKRDKEKARKSKGEYSVVTNSGAGRTKLDLVGDIDAVETKFTDAASYRLKAKDLKKLFAQVKRTGRRGTYKWPVMEVTMKDDEGNELTVVILQPDVYENLKKKYRAFV
jgi:hypothetical protein